MKISNIDVNAIIANARQQLRDDASVSPSLRSTIEIHLLVIPILLGRVSTNSRNSSKPGGQQRCIGTTIVPTDDADDIKVLTIDRRTLPRGHLNAYEITPIKSETQDGLPAKRDDNAFAAFIERSQNVTKAEVPVPK